MNISKQIKREQNYKRKNRMEMDVKTFCVSGQIIYQLKKILGVEFLYTLLKPHRSFNLRNFK